jgi:hypothetical protein
MTIPTTDIGLDDIWNEAGNPSGNDYPFGTLADINYFEGSNGSGSYSYNGYGQNGNSSGADIIYNLPTRSTDFQYDDFKGLDYFYDGATYDGYANATNNLSIPPFPAPPSANDFQVDVYLYDSTKTYVYAQGNFTANAQGIVSAQIINASFSPLIDSCYWEIILTSDPQGTTGGNFDLNINGNPIFTGQSLPTGGSQSSWDWQGFSAPTMGSTGQGYTGFYLDMNMS